jgi:hypothetical protein
MSLLLLFSGLLALVIVAGLIGNAVDRYLDHHTHTGEWDTSKLLRHTHEPHHIGRHRRR